MMPNYSTCQLPCQPSLTEEVARMIFQSHSTFFLISKSNRFLSYPLKERIPLIFLVPIYSLRLDYPYLHQKSCRAHLTPVKTNTHYSHACICIRGRQMHQPTKWAHWRHRSASNTYILFSTIYSITDHLKIEGR